MSGGWTKRPRAAMGASTSTRHTVRYFECDQQGVVFNMWYLGYFDEALSAFLTAGGLSYRKLIETGFDMQVLIPDGIFANPFGSPVGRQWEPGLRLAVEPVAQRRCQDRLAGGHAQAHRRGRGRPVLP